MGEGIPPAGSRRDEGGPLGHDACPSMKIHDLDLLRSLIAPPEYDPPPIVYSDRMPPARSPRKASRRYPGGATRSPSIWRCLVAPVFGGRPWRRPSETPLAHIAAGAQACLSH